MRRNSMSSADNSFGMRLTNSEAISGTSITSCFSMPTFRFFSSSSKSTPCIENTKNGSLSISRLIM